MQIKNGLKQFENEKVLLAVTGDYQAKFFTAGEGEINLAAEIKAEILESRGNEGFFGGKKGGSKGRMGSPSFEAPKEYLFKKFAVKFKTAVMQIEQKNLPIYLFAPSIIHNQLAAVLPKAIAKRIIMNIPGNFLQLKPFDLIEKLGKKVVSGKPVVEEKARRLLRK
jgi:hypothetical protein